MNAIFSIKPQYAEQIISGVKTFEYRKTKLNQDINKIYIYATAPTKKVIGEATIKEVHIGSPFEIWENTFEKGGIIAVDYLKYFEGSSKAVAYELTNVTKYESPKNYIDIDSSGKVPQSFKYIDEKES